MPARIGDPRRRRRHFIREWRIFRGLTQEGLAELIGTTKTSVSRIEALETGYTQDFLEACADALGTHPGTLLLRAPTRYDSDAEQQPTARRDRGGRLTPPSARIGPAARARRSGRGTA